MNEDIKYNDNKKGNNKNNIHIQLYSRYNENIEKRKDNSP